MTLLADEADFDPEIHGLQYTAEDVEYATIGDVASWHNALVRMLWPAVNRQMEGDFTTLRETKIVTRLV